LHRYNEEGQVGEVMEEVVQVIGEDGEITEEVRMVPKPVKVKGELSPAQQLIVALTRLMDSSEVIRKVALTYALRRLQVGDVHSARPILAAAGSMSDAALNEESAVAVTLARRLVGLALFTLFCSQKHLQFMTAVVPLAFDESRRPKFGLR
jgi:hypothetical protein